MQDWLKLDLDYLIDSLKRDIEMISNKDKDIEWKRDHYRYTSAVSFSRILNLLNAQITETPPAPIKDSTRIELVNLRRIIDSLIGVR